MKKVIVLLIVLFIGLLGYDAYEFLNMQKVMEDYELVIENKKELLEIEANNNKEISELEKQLDKLKKANLENNTEYEIWMNLNQTVQNSLK